MTEDQVGAVSPPRAAVAGPHAVGGAEQAPSPASAQVQPPVLSRREHEMLVFERHWWRRAGAKETAIRDRFGVPPTRYYQALNALVDRADALAADPLLIHRLRRLRGVRQRTRSSRGPVQPA
jgi:hypothetical protein